MRTLDDTEKQLEQFLRTVEESRSQLISNQKRISEIILDILPGLDGHSSQTKDFKLAWDDMQSKFDIVFNSQTPELESTLEKRLRLLRVFLDEF